MEAIVISGKHKSELEMLFALAKKLGLNSRKLNKKEIDDFGFVLKIEDGLKSGKAGKKEVRAFLGL